MVHGELAWSWRKENSMGGADMDFRVGRMMCRAEAGAWLILASPSSRVFRALAGSNIGDRANRYMTTGAN